VSTDESPDHSPTSADPQASHIPQGRWTPDRAREYWRVWAVAWNSHDADQLLGLVVDDVLWEDPNIRGGVLHGKDAAREWLESIWRAVPDLTFEIIGDPFVSLDGTRLAATWRCLGHFTGPGQTPGWAPTNGPLEATGMEVLEFEGDLIRKESSFFDMISVARQFGAVPEPGSLAERVGVRMQHLAARRLRRRNAA
jgi:steroid delta-isomerase-like uncharacterized protein